MRRGTLYYLMVPLMAVAALLQSTAFNRLTIAGVKPDLVLLLVVVGTLLYGPRAGIVWAFVGGLFLDVFSGGPLGSSSLALMAAAVVAGFGHTTLSRFNVFVPLGAIILGTLTYGVVYTGTLLALNGLIDLTGVDALHHRLPLWETVQQVVLPSIAYNTVLMLLLIPILNRIPETPETVSVFQ
jgi:rod shape-determining protein MreD